MKVLAKKTTWISNVKLISSKISSEEDDSSFRKVVRLAPSCCFPTAEASRKP
jgi:hypothetical protein